jgi:hypothetical protein
MSAWTCRYSDGKAAQKAAQKIVPPRPRIPYWKGPGAKSEEKHEPASDIDIVVVDSLKALDPEWPIREADVCFLNCGFRGYAESGQTRLPGILCLKKLPRFGQPDRIPSVADWLCSI